MIRKLLVFFSFCIVLSSCKKNDDVCTFTPSGVVVPASELTTLQTYIANNSIPATLHPGGFYYEITTTGTGTVTPEICSDVTVKYAGFLTSGLKFTTPDEENIASTFALGQLIAGWQRGIPLVKAGSVIRLYLPPSLGYGSTTVGSIPGNSIIIFNIQLLDVR